MKRFRPMGVKWRLSLTAIAVVTVLYVLLGWAVQIKARTAILGSIDSTLKEMASHQRTPPGPPPGEHRPGDGGGPPPFDRDHHDPRHRPPDWDHDDHHHEDHGFPIMQGPAGGGASQPTTASQPKVEEVDVHETRPRIVWHEKGFMLPFPLAKATDVDAVYAARRGVETLRTITYNGDPVQVITIPVRDNRDHHVIGVSQINYWLGDVYKTLDSLTATLLLILPFGILLMGGASAFVVGKTLKPVRDMTSAAAKIEAENLGGRLQVVGDDEFAELASTMNSMLGRLEVSFADQRQTLDRLQEVLRQQRRFTADASHELKTPLAVVKVNASLLKTFLGSDLDAVESVDSIDQAVNRMSKLVQDLLLLARTDAGQLEDQFTEVDLISTVDQAASTVTCAKRIDIVAPDQALVVHGSQFALERLFTNILDNACRHSESDTRVKLELSASGINATIRVVDHGEGIPEEHLSKIFERFHRVDGSRHSGTGGAGLGLAISKGIVEAHGGRISVESKLDVGTTFTIELPLISQ